MPLLAAAFRSPIIATFASYKWMRLGCFQAPATSSTHRAGLVSCRLSGGTAPGRSKNRRPASVTSVSLGLELRNGAIDARELYEAFGKLGLKFSQEVIYLIAVL